MSRLAPDATSIDQHATDHHRQQNHPEETP
jgi:hypothetical protein